jgi:hypothetical protein
MPISPKELTFEMFAADLALKLRQPIRRLSALGTVRLNFFYSQMEKSAPVLPRVIKGCFVLDLISSSTLHRANIKVTGESYRTVDIWTQISLRPSEAFFEFLQTSYADFRIRSELGCESHASTRYGHFAITNINAMLRGFTGLDVELLSSYETDDPLMARVSFSDFSARFKEGRVVASLYNFI